MPYAAHRAHEHAVSAQPPGSGRLRGGNRIIDDVTLVFTGGAPPPAAVADRLPHDAFVIAADSGLDHARALGRRVDLVIGDLDSVDLDGLADARAAGARVEPHPTDKDATDLELALDAALARGAPSVTLVGGGGGRVDHFLANLTVLASPRYASARLDAWIGPAYLVVIRGDTDLVGAPGSLVTLVPLGGAALGVSTEGLRYPLADEDLEAGTSRGISNEFADARARVRLRAGTLVAIQPDALNDVDPGQP